ncbi:aldo/keto reductase [Galbitalea sp. SE-J8]|uniref:aldo/keto reductase n=1 Tax=Galbitalea sp. SE-J8 TaxID=3054952 RepID=UPI00259CB905|nr:aldo/keto reductase [Galbitalea sp. SE-J8]MDM4762369.1 aldo/keto reductase [Galbitalea sp. SE-J8]
MTRIGTSDLDATLPLDLGGNVFGWTADRDASFAVLDAFAAAGGTLIDTADSYSAWVPGHTGGESEVLIGEWMNRRGNRDRLVVSTKVSQHPEFRGLAADTVRDAADASLTRLGTDRIDLYFAHFDDEDTPLEETVEAFDALVRAGKVRYVGISNYSADRVDRWLQLSEENGWAKPVALQPHYNLVHRATFERELAPVVERGGLGVLPYYGLAAGFLTGKYRSEADLGASPRGRGAARYLTDAGLALLGTLGEVAAAHAVAPASVALAWLRTRPHVVAPIASARSAEQLGAVLASTALDLEPAELAALDTASAAVEE